MDIFQLIMFHFLTKSLSNNYLNLHVFTIDRCCKLKSNMYDLQWATHAGKTDSLNKCVIKIKKIYFFVSLVTFLKFKFIYFNWRLLLCNIVLVLPYINMNLPQVYTCSPFWTPLPPPSPYHPSGSSQCTSPKHPVSCIEPRLAIRFLYNIIRVSK